MLALVVAFIALTADVMRVIYAGYKLQSGVESAALAAYSYASDHSGTFSKSNVINKLSEISGSIGPAWNKAPAGPDSQLNKFETPIRFDNTDVVFVPNINDNSEEFLQLKARRDGLDSIKLFFVPAIFAFNSLVGLPTPQGTNLSNTYRVTEIISQPASRIGEGVPVSEPDTGRNGDLKGFASFPLALSNLQFAVAANPGESNLIYTIDLVSNVKPLPPVVSAGHIRGSFINLSATGSSLASYGSGQGTNAVSELERLIDYFQLAPSAQAESPYIVERGSIVNTFDPESAPFKLKDTALKAELNSILLSNRFQIFPVIANNPVIGDNQATNNVVGFARMKFTNIVNASDGSFQIQVQIGESLPVRNASATNSLATIPTIDGSLLPKPVAPFAARNSGIDGQTIGARPRGVVLAPSISPKLVKQIEVASQ